MLLDVLSTEAKGRMGELHAQELSNLSWSFAVVRVFDRNLFDAIACQAIHTSPSFLILNLTNTFWAFATVGYEHGPLVEVIAAACIKNMDHFYGQAISATAW